MNLKLTKNRTLWLGNVLIVLYYFLNKFDFILNASFAEGVAIRVTRIQFEVNNKMYEFASVRNVTYSIGEKLRVIYLTSHPGNASVYSFFGFWYIGLVYTIVPIAVWSALVLAFVNEDENFFLSFFKKERGQAFNFTRKKLNE